MIKRKRLSRPKTLIIFGILFLLLPFLNYYFLSRQLGVSLKSFQIIFLYSDIFALILMLLPIPVGIGIINVKRWGWQLFLVYAGILILYNLQVFVFNFKLYNFVALFNSIIGILAILYFVRKDISAPYFKMYPRGWRLQKRKPIEMEVSVNGKSLKTTDVSSTGFYAVWVDCPYNINQEVNVHFALENKVYDLQAGIVRVDETGVGVAFRGLQKLVSKELSGFVKDL